MDVGAMPIGRITESLRPLFSGKLGQEQWPQASGEKQVCSEVIIAHKMGLQGGISQNQAEPSAFGGTRGSLSRVGGTREDSCIPEESEHRAGLLLLGGHTTDCDGC